ncbi:MAG: helix-turn-helix domain-containing protein [Planctomycetaceae bacterium]
MTAAAAAQTVTLARAGVAVWHGETLGQELAAAVAGDRFDRFTSMVAALRLVVVNRIDLAAGADMEESLTHLFDVSMAAGTAWCVSMPRLPPAGLDPRCVTRLGAGLVVPATIPPVSGATATGHAPALGRIIRSAARYHDVPVAAILGPARMRTVAAARSLAMYLARRLTGRSFHSIGAAFGGRDHTTVLHAVRVCGTRIARDPAFAADVERLAVALTGAAGVAPPDAEGALRRRSPVGSAALASVLATRRRDRRRQA